MVLGFRVRGDKRSAVWVQATEKALGTGSDELMPNYAA